MPSRKKKKATKSTNNNENSSSNKQSDNGGKPKEQFVEPDIKWEKSKAKRYLYEAIMDKRVPATAKGVNKLGLEMTLKEIFLSIPELAFYDYKMLSSRLSSLRKTIGDANYWADLDQKALDNFKTNHPPAIYTHKGHVQWQGSDAKKQLKQDIIDGLLERMGKKELWGSRSVYYENFPLAPFRDKIRQTVRTEKYMYTLRVKGKQHKSS